MSNRQGLGPQRLRGAQLALPTDPQDSGGDQVSITRESPALLVVDGLGKTYGSGQSKTVAIQRLDFAVDPGEFVSVVGPSGCGKTTLLKCIAGLIRPSTGLSSLRGQTIQEPPADLAVVFQDYARSLYPWLTVQKNVLLPLRRRPKTERLRLADEAITAVGLSQFRDHYPWQLSGGMQQRVAIARALAYQPKVLLMDEPFASVDAQTRAELEDLVLRVRSEFNITVLFVTHDIDESVYMSDRVVVLSRPPSHVQEIVTIDLPRARDQLTTKAMPEFAELRSVIYQMITGAKTVISPAEVEPSLAPLRPRSTPTASPRSPMSLLSRTDLIASYYTLNGVAGPARMKPNRYTFEERITAAKNAGFTGVGLALERDRTQTPAELAEIALAHEIDVAELEFLPGWFLEGEAGQDSANREKRLFELADAFHTRQLNAGITLPRGELPPISLLGAKFGELCDRAADHGMVVALEPIWVFALETPQQAADIVAAAGRVNGGVLIDAYHVFRGHSSIEDLEKIPPELINGLQLGDTPEEMTLEPKVENEHARRLPGEGGGDVVGLLVTLDRMGVDVPIALEVLSDDLRAEPLDQASRHAYETSANVLEQARSAARLAG
jgi:NitT/TauT family transport system ATP-binding protein